MESNILSPPYSSVQHDDDCIVLSTFLIHQEHSQCRAILRNLYQYSEYFQLLNVVSTSPPFLFFLRCSPFLSICVELCEDRREHCKEYAANGQCDSSPGWMIMNW
jgi:ShK domain-like